MNQEPKVSVIIPYYNQGHFLLEALDTINVQDYQNIEVIIVNDGSTDKESLYVLETIRSAYNSFLILTQENLGPSVARNNAVKHSSGEFLLFLDADDRIHQQTIRYCIEEVSKDEMVGVIYGNYQRFGEKAGLQKQAEFEIIQMLRANQIALCSMVRKKAFLDVGGFDEILSLKGVEDWDLWLNLYEKNWKFKYIDELMFDIRVHKDSRTYTVAERNIEDSIDYVYKKHSKIVARNFLELYHNNKNLRNTIDYKLGKVLLSPFRIMKSVFLQRE